MVKIRCEQCFTGKTHGGESLIVIQDFRQTRPLSKHFIDSNFEQIPRIDQK
jgi:hypothetical protein